jgi:hypothetical protein
MSSIDRPIEQTDIHSLLGHERKGSETMNNQVSVTFHHEDEDFVTETKGGYLAKGVHFKSFEMLFLKQWADENLVELEENAENDLEIAKKDLFQMLCSLTAEKYEVTLLGMDSDEVQVVPLAYIADPEHPSGSEAVIFSNTIVELKEYIRYYGGEIG